MNLYRKRLDLVFLACLIFALMIPALFPTLRLFFFAPFLIISYYKKPFNTCLWLSLLCGLICDLLSSYSRLGIYALSYSATTYLLYRQKERFFSDSLSTLPLMTFLFSFILTTIQWLILDLFEHKMSMSFGWVLYDLLLMPLADAAYAFGYFILPFAVLGKPRRKGSDYFLEGSRVSKI